MGTCAVSANFCSSDDIPAIDGHVGGCDFAQISKSVKRNAYAKNAGKASRFGT